MTTFGNQPQQPDNTNKYPLAKSPRQLPTIQKVHTLLHGALIQIGFAFFSIGLLISIFFYTLFLKTEYLNNNGKWIDATAVLTDVKTKTSKNSADSYSYYYSIEIDGKKSQRFSNSSKRLDKEIGDTLAVQYHSIHTSESDIIGMRADVPAFVVKISLIFPLVGLIILTIGLLKNRKTLHLYQFGEFTWGRLLSCKATNTHTNKKTQYLCEFEFVAHDRKTYKTQTKTTTPYLLEDEEDELILYRRENPDYNIVYDASPAAPTILPDGSLQARYFFSDYIGLIIFLLSLIGDIIILFSPLV